MLSLYFLEEGQTKKVSSKFYESLEKIDDKIKEKKYDYIQDLFVKSGYYVTL